MKTRKLALIAYCAAALISSTLCKLQSDQHIKHHVGGGMRLRKGTDTPSKKTVSISHMSSDELVEHIQMAVEKKQWSAALKYI
jgi:hypothetical protein